MENSTLRKNLIMFILLAVFTSGCGEQAPKDSPVVEAAADTLIKKINSLSGKFEEEAQETNKKRRTENSQALQKDQTYPIDTKFGEIYMQAYRNELRSKKSDNTVWSVILKRENLAFYIKYLDEHPGATIVAAFGKYDPSLLAANGLTDAYLEINPAYKNQHGLIIGIQNPRYDRAGDSIYCSPFEKNGEMFYDDWHNGWPPPIDSAK